MVFQVLEGTEIVLEYTVAGETKFDSTYNDNIFVLHSSRSC